MKLLFAAFFLSFLLTSCFISTKRLYFQNTEKLTFNHVSFNNDSIRCLFLIEAKERTVVVPFFIFSRDKKKSRICYRLYGKGVSAREYTCKLINLTIKNDSEVVGRSKDTALFVEKKEIKYLAGAISPFYSTDYLLELMNPAKLNLAMEMEFKIISKNGVTETQTLKMPLKKISEKSFKLFNPNKK